VKLHAPKTLRDALGLAYLHRGSELRWLLGRSELLGVDIASVPRGAFIIDARKIPEFRAIDASPSRANLGVLAPLAEVSARGDVGPVFFPDGRITRLRLCALDARLSVAGAGAMRHIALESAFAADGSLALGKSEAPLALELHVPRAGYGVAERRLITKDGAASFVLELHVRLRLTALGRLEGTRIFVLLDGGAPMRARDAEERLDRREPEPQALADASRLAAGTIDPADVRAAAAARAIPMLVMGALKDALGECAQGYRTQH
jgi:CO/xanthine dehydrogenase FAD-binding subunit